MVSEWSEQGNENFRQVPGRIRRQNQGKQWRYFEEARAYVRTHGLSKEEWEAYCKSGQKPADIPVNPENVYKDQWKGLNDWVQEFKQSPEWHAYRESGQKPDDIPSKSENTKEDL